MSQIRKNKKRKFNLVDQQKQALDNLAVISQQDFMYESQANNPQNIFFRNMEQNSRCFPKIQTNSIRQKYCSQLKGQRIVVNEQGSCFSVNYKKGFSQSLIKKKTFQQQLLNAFKTDQQYTNRSPNRFNKHCLGITNFMLFDARCKSSEPVFRSASKVEKDISHSKVNRIKRVMQRKQKTTYRNQTSESSKSSTSTPSPSKIVVKSHQNQANSSQVKVIYKIDDKLKQKFANLSSSQYSLSQRQKLTNSQKGKKIYIQLQNPIKLSKVPLHEYYKKYVL